MQDAVSIALHTALTHLQLPNTPTLQTDDTTIVGLISDNDETHYREEIQHLTQWWSNNKPCSEHQQDQGGHSGLQTGGPGGQSTLLSSSTGKQSERVNNIKFLGIHITSDLTWSSVVWQLHCTRPKGLSPGASLRSFLGLCAWYSKFMPNYASVVEPMRALLWKNSAFIWNDAAQASFAQVKGMIANGPALKLFDPNKSTVVSTDASDYRLRAILTQVNDAGEEETVAFASHSLSDAERKYSIVEKETLTCIWAAEK
ncbi:hypothetical protein L3Q82_018374, partial [Scortum barcoo]